MRKRLLSFLSVMLLLALFMTNPLFAQSTSHVLIPIGSDYRSDTLQLFARAAAQRDNNGTIDLLVLPITYGTDALVTKNAERKKNLSLADNRRSQVEDACNAIKLPTQNCRAVLAPVLIHDDALLQSNLDLFVPDLDGIYILGGDQGIAMQVIANTPFEDKMADAFAAGAVIGGNSAGAAVQSRNMINGYIGNFGPEDGFQLGTVDYWQFEGTGDETRGLRFGAIQSIFDQHFFQRGRFARLMNLVLTTNLFGVGVDAETGAVVTDESVLSNVTGATSAMVLDPRTYSATSTLGGPKPIVTGHRVTTHLIPPGNFGYDFALRQPLVDGLPIAAPSIAGRSFGALQLPAGYGTLTLTGDLAADRSGVVSQRFVNLAGNSNARLVVIALGYAKSNLAQADAKAFATALQSLGAGSVQWFVADSRLDLAAAQNAIANASGILVTSAEQSQVMSGIAQSPALMDSIHTAWAQGKPLLADNAFAAALGAQISTDPTPTADSLEADSMGDMLLNGVTIQPGLGWLAGLAVEPRLVAERHWGRMYNHLYRNPALLGLGIDVNTAVEVTSGGATAWGINAVVVLDGRQATYSVGTNGAVGARYVHFDSYANGDTVIP